MARKRSHHHKRSHQSGPRRHGGANGSERSYYEYLLSGPAHMISREDLLRVIRGGEDTYLELKVRFSNVEKLIAEIIALANTDGGAIVFGVNDQLRVEGVDDPESVEEQLREICGRQIQPPVIPWMNKVAFDNGRRIVVLEIPTADRPHRTLDDRFYLREGAIKRETTREELSRLYQETHLTRFEQVPVFDAVLARDIDDSLFWSYIRGVDPGEWSDGTKGFPTDTVMREMGLAEKIGEQIVPTIGGMILFGKGDRVGELLPKTELLVARYSGNSPEAPVIEQQRLRGNLFQLFDGAWRFIDRFVDLREARPSRRLRTESREATGHDDPHSTFVPVRASYHREAILEALINSLIHRDWSARDREARIAIFDESIELTNPAQPIVLPISSIRYGMTSAPNPRLKAVFTNEHYGVPATQGGLTRLIAATTDFVRRAPEGGTISWGEFRIKVHGLI